MTPNRAQRRHPAVEILRYRGLTYEQLGQEIGRSGESLRLALNGHVVSSAILRRLVAAYLDLPVSVCFHDADAQEQPA